MTDREMLELAAKAIGASYRSGCGDGRIIPLQWNPLTDDGDALRLAVKLDIYLRFEWYLSKQIVTACGDGFWIEETVSDSKEAATRRAITRAAAEIGRKHMNMLEWLIWWAFRIAVMLGLSALAVWASLLVSVT